MDWSRRDLLAAMATGGALALAGCDSSGERTPTGGGTTTSSSTTAGTTPADSTGTLTTDRATPEPRIAAVTFRAAYRYGVNDDGIGVLAPENAQFAFVRVASVAGDPPPSAFTLSLGDRDLSPLSSVPGFMPMTPGVDGVYTDDHRSGELVFDVPTVETDDASLRYDGRTLTVPTESRSTFATAPSLELESVSAPEGVSPDERIELRVTATNVGDREGLFLAGFRSGGLPKPLDIPVPPNETIASSVTYDASTEADTMYFAFDHPDGDRSIEVRIEDRSPT